MINFIKITALNNNLIFNSVSVIELVEVMYKPVQPMHLQKERSQVKYPPPPQFTYIIICDNLIFRELTQDAAILDPSLNLVPVYLHVCHVDNHDVA